MPPQNSKISKPMILAPAGGRESFLAAVAAGADAVYCGLKQFSARMAAENFTIDDLLGLSKLARSKGIKVYIALNTLVKPDEMDRAGGLLKHLARKIKPDAIIIQDLAFVSLARQAEYRGEIHLSTLSNVSFPSALEQAKKCYGVKRIVAPRELSVDEIKSFCDACPAGMSLEVFVHGALCYGISGRCYWSSFLGGKSGLRGRCVQPCRRLYDIKGSKKRFFSCQDYSLDVLAKVLLSEKKISAWKIEGRKKGPHYVYYTVKAYRLFRDHAKEPNAKKEALSLLEMSLGRKSSHYNFLPQRPQVPVKTNVQTGSGLLLGEVKGALKSSYLVPRQALLKGDILRIGYEDEPRHTTYRVTKNVPKKGRLVFKFSGKSFGRSRAPVFLIDRREKFLEQKLSELGKKLEKTPENSSFEPGFKAVFHVKKSRKRHSMEMRIQRKPDKKKRDSAFGLWLSSDTADILSEKDTRNCWWWLPPVIWPEEEKSWKLLINRVLKKGGKNFILNTFWQIALFNQKKGLNFWAGPFCNTANPLAIENLAVLGFSGIIVSPELNGNDYKKLGKRSSLPLGIVLSGNWPLCISRTSAENFKTGSLFSSPRGEQAWAVTYGSNFWVFPNWKLNLEQYRNDLFKAGFEMFVHIEEPLPRGIKMKKRPGVWNWNMKLL